MKNMIFALGMLIVIALSGCAQTTVDSNGDNGMIVGGDKDEHGCIGSAGYSWCEEKGKCIRSWEEPCVKDDLLACEIDSDCIPNPADCHPKFCINKDYENDFDKPEICTMQYEYSAAYEPEDCICKEGICTNKNIGRTPEEIQ